MWLLLLIVIILVILVVLVDVDDLVAVHDSLAEILRVALLNETGQIGRVATGHIQAERTLLLLMAQPMVAVHY